MARAQFRYSASSFRATVWAAAGLTAIVSFLVWLMSQLLGVAHYNVVTLVSGLIFFGFCSAAMIWSYLRREIVLSIRPEGLMDRRYSQDRLPWDAIKDVKLARREHEFQLSVYLWPRSQNREAEQDGFVIDLAPLDGDVREVISAIAPFRTVTIPGQ